MKFDYVVFDWDGTLADTCLLISSAYEHTSKTLGTKIYSYDEIKNLTSTIQNKDILKYVYGEKENEAKKVFYNYVRKNHVDKLKPVCGAKNLLEFCCENNLKVFLITNKKRELLIKEMEKLGFEKFFANVVAAGDFSQDKPHPMATKALFGTSLPKAESILVVGDGEADWKTARTFDDEQSKSCCVIYDPKNTYKGSEPDYVVDDLCKVIDILKENK